MGQDTGETQYKVSDRRRFSPEGEPLESTPETDEPQPSAAHEPLKAEAEEQPSRPGPDQEPAWESGAIPPASFELLVLSLAMQAQMELEPGGPEGQVPNLDLARHTIDLLAILQKKTKGNLELEESRLLENTLTDLRFRYVQRVEQINKKATSGPSTPSAE